MNFKEEEKEVPSPKNDQQTSP